MKFTLNLSFTDPNDFLELAQTAEAHGIDTIVLSDHIAHFAEIESMYPYNKTGERPWVENAPWPDVWVASAAMAAATTKINFLQGVYVLPMRDPFSMAKAIGTASVISRGRVGLGLGLGWMKEEFDLMGHDFKTRGKRADEMVELMRKLWTGEMVEHHGTHYDFPPMKMHPSVPHEIPVIVGGNGPPALCGAARLGGGWSPCFQTLAQLKEKRVAIQKLRREYGTDGKPFAVDGSLEDSAEVELDVSHYKGMEDLGIPHCAAKISWDLDVATLLPLGAIRGRIKRFGDEVTAKIA
jgi:probable F420-dependent oxidoreductase